jgi:5S rRNA maturation endonuclease (ribonuclease M5)
MRKQPLMQLMGMLGLKVYDINGGWLKVNCPIAHSTHEDKDDTNPSCGISINDDGPSIVHCFTCGTRTLADVLHVLYWTKGFDSKIFRVYLENEVLNEESSEHECIYHDGFAKPKKEQPVVVPDEIFQTFEPVDQARDYLEGRGIDVEVARKHGLMYLRKHITPKGGVWENAIVCPIRDTDFKTYWIHFRSIDSKRFWHGKPEHFGVNIEWGRDDSWFAIEFLNRNEPIILVEGVFDCLRLKTLGVENVIAAHGGLGKNSPKLNRILDIYPKILYTGFDADKAGRQFREAVRRRATCEVIDLDWSKAGIKDPGELKSKQDLLTVLQTETYEFQDKFNRRKSYAKMV